MRRAAALRATIPVVTLALIASAGCSGEKTMICNRDTAYLEAGTVDPLRIPDDLQVPDESGALRIPEAVSSGVPDEERAGSCLEASPAFSPTD
jgi:uncharacterized lipoprotein